MQVKFTETTDGSVLEWIKQWQEAIKEADTVVGDVTFETIAGTVTYEGTEYKVMGMRRVDHEGYSDLEFIKEDNTVLRFKNIQDISKDDEFPIITYTYDPLITD